MNSEQQGSVEGVRKGVEAEIRYSEIRKEMSSLYFGLDGFCQFEAIVLEFDAVFSVHCTL
jgi:hypothetical protein